MATKVMAWSAINSIRRPNPEIIRYCLIVLFAGISFAIVQKAMPNKIPHTGLLRVKTNVITMLSKIEFPVRKGTYVFRMKAINWNKKYSKGTLTTLQYLTFHILTVDGVNMQNVDKYRITSDLFNTTLANNNIGGVAPGPTQGVSDGWWFILHPLSVGSHTIHFIGTLGSPTVTPTLTSTNPRFASEVTYHITVK